MTIKSIEALTSNVVTPVNFDEIKVSFGCGIIHGFAESYTSAINNKLAFRGSSISFDSTAMQKYLNLLLKTRIDYINGRRMDGAFKQMFIPSLYGLAIAQIGMVYEKDLGIQLIPAIDEDIEIMTIDEALSFSRKLQMCEDLGFEMNPGLPTDRDGSKEFMFFHMADEKIVRHAKDASPAYAALTAFFRMEQLSSMLTLRVNYGLISEYENMLHGLISDSLRNGTSK